MKQTIVVYSFMFFGVRSPGWNIALVLCSLMRSLFELLQEANRHLTLKSMFLHVLASAKRVCGLHGLSCTVTRSGRLRIYYFSYVPGFFVISRIHL